MKRKERKPMYKKFSGKDIFVILISILALAGLIVVILYSNQINKEKQEKLNQISSEMEPEEHTAEKNEKLLEQIVINEVNQEGWIELYNKGAKEIGIGGVIVQVNGDICYRIPEGTSIKEQEILVIELGKSLQTGQENIISVSDEATYAYDLLVPELNEKESYSRKEDGEAAIVFMNPTKGSTNTDGTINKRNWLTFSVPGGFYDSAVYVELDAPAGCTVYYTLDGTTPDENSKVYTKGIEIANRSGSKYLYATSRGISYESGFVPSSLNMGTILKAVAVDAEGNKSDVVTQSYFIELANSNDCAEVSVLSITADPTDLFDYFDGIYVSGRDYEDNIAKGGDGGSSGNFRKGWKKDAYIEYFEAGKGKTYQSSARIQVLDDFSVTAPQKSFLFSKITERGTEGSSILDYISDGELLLQTNRKDNAYKIREYLANKLLENSNAGTAQIEPCVVFLDGEYWGEYMLRRAYDESYIQEHYNVKDDIVFAEANRSFTEETPYGSFYQFVVSGDMSVSENYKQVEEQMDIQSYLDYFCANMMLANADYGKEKVIIWKSASINQNPYNDGKWRWLMGNLDNTMDNGTTGNVATYSIDTYLQPEVTSDLFFASLLKNDSFKEALKTTMEKMVNETFSKTKVESALKQIVSQNQKLAENSYNRFYGAVTEEFYSSEVEKIQTFFENRGTYILQYTDEMIKEGIQTNELETGAQK